MSKKLKVYNYFCKKIIWPLISVEYVQKYASGGQSENGVQDESDVSSVMEYSDNDDIDDLDL